MILYGDCSMLAWTRSFNDSARSQYSAESRSNPPVTLLPVSVLCYFEMRSMSHAMAVLRCSKPLCLLRTPN